ncbi:uncharacterized protein LOC114355863 [Ostrinia furnacalis]|uniref:uncharacterized protein LOC114355863 n=1 Tax=Ostrinia furnacalis TaxID=93504 RepID=UPI001040BECF|nr:uncharacterized protein LOC114355863 [Ostrinia furnacalis]
MFKKTVLLLAIASAYATEISSSYALLEKHSTFKPDLKTEPIDEKHRTSEAERHPVYNPEDYRRAFVKPVESAKPVSADHDRMLADQPAENNADVSRIDNLQIPGYGYYMPAPTDVAYPDVPYAPGYAYAPSNYDMYVEPDTSVASMLWSQVPDSRSIVGFVATTISKIMANAFLILVGAFITVGICSYTSLCHIHINGIGPIQEEMRSLMTPEKLQKIGHAAEFVKTAIDKYQKIQGVENVEASRRRRSIFF